MDESIHLSELQSTLEELTYPITRDEVATELGDVRVLYADGDELLSALVARSTRTRFDSATDLAADLRECAPIEAIGEPGQSEGDA